MNIISDVGVFTPADMLAFKYKYKHMTLDEFVHYKMGKPFAVDDPLLGIKILDLCCRVTGSDITMAMSKNRATKHVFARQMAMFFMKAINPKWSDKYIGEEVAGKDHATVLYARRTILNVIDPMVPGDFRRRWFNIAQTLIENRLKRNINIYF